MLSANNDSFVSSFPVWMLSTSSSCMITVARTSTTMLNKSDGSGHPCLVPDLKGDASSFSPLKTMLPVGFSCMVFIILRCDPSIRPLVRGFFFFFNYEWVLDFIKYFSASIDMIM